MRLRDISLNFRSELLVLFTWCANHRRILQHSSKFYTRILPNSIHQTRVTCSKNRKGSSEVLCSLITGLESLMRLSKTPFIDKVLTALWGIRCCDSKRSTANACSCEVSISQCSRSNSRCPIEQRFSRSQQLQTVPGRTTASLVPHCSPCPLETYDQPLPYLMLVFPSLPPESPNCSHSTTTA